MVVASFSLGVDAARTNAWRMLQRTEKVSQFPFVRVIAKTLIALVHPTKGRKLLPMIQDMMVCIIGQRNCIIDASNVVQGQCGPAANAKFRCTPNVSESTI